MKNNDNTGFCVAYTVRDTHDKGRGVFAGAPIAKGMILWRHLRGQYAVFDERSLKEMLAKLSRSEAAYELTHMYGLPEFPGFIIRIFDHGVLINHSRQPTAEMNIGSDDNEIPLNGSPQNIQDVEEALLNDCFALIATKDLKPGDELTTDYSIGIEDPAYYDELCEQFDVTEPWL